MLRGAKVAGAQRHAGRVEAAVGKQAPGCSPSGHDGDDRGGAVVAPAGAFVFALQAGAVTGTGAAERRGQQMATVFDNTGDLQAAVGQELGFSDWVEITQERVNTFADATGDHQWIHVDPERAKDGPFGAPIAHGYLTLSLISMMLPQVITVNNVAMGVNCGTDKVRFLAPVKVGSRVRAGGELVKADETRDGAVQATIRVTIEIEGSDKPACVADTISRFYPAG
jgi:acyl dehydratase